MRNHDVDEARSSERVDLRYLGPEIPITQTFGRPLPVEKAAAPASAPRRFSMASLRQILGAKKPAPATIDEKISSLRAEIAMADARQREASDKLKQPGLLTDAEHQKAEADVDAARRLIVRHEDVIRGLEAEREVLVAAESKAAFLKNVEAARARAAQARIRLANEYEPAAKLIASILSDLKASQAEIESLIRQGREFGETVEIESPYAACGTADVNLSLAVAAQIPDLASDVSLPGLKIGSPDIVSLDRARFARRFTKLA